MLNYILGYYLIGILIVFVDFMRDAKSLTIADLLGVLFAAIFWPLFVYIYLSENSYLDKIMNFKIWKRKD